jgi:Family of unknown function (DUF5985)
MSRAYTLMSGATVMACFVSGLFFLRFWRTTGDRLFVFFAIAFVTLAGHWTALALASPDFEFRPLLYGVRLAAFVMILLAIADKNRLRRG